jgi:hypothetical protein
MLAAATTQHEPAAFSVVKVAFCDSLAALQSAYDRGLPRAARIRTSSPALFFSGLPGIEPLQEAQSERRLTDYWDTALPLTIAVKNSVGKDVDPDLGILAARVALTFHRQITNAIDLTDADFEEPRVAIAVETGSAAANALLNPRWRQWLACNPNFQELRFSVATAKTEFVGQPPWHYRVRLFNWYGLGVRCLAKAGVGWKGAPRVYLHSSNDLVNETAWHLGLRGAVVAKLSIPQAPGAPKRDANHELIARTEPPVTAFLSRWLAPPARARALDLFKTSLGSALNDYRSMKPIWDREIARLSKRGGPAIVLANILSKPDSLALAASCRDAGVLVVAAQHGFTREICANHTATSANYENGGADMFLAYSREAKRATEASPFGRGVTHAVGIPSLYFRVRRPRRSASPRPMLYVSTCLYAGNVNFLNGGVSDIARARWECDLINNVLARLPHKLMYKTYPSRDRYVDPDPVVELARTKANIKVFDAAVDLRYILSQHNVIVTSRATGTALWCLMSRRPLVFIDIPDHAPLTAEARRAFEAGLFLFDSSDRQFHEKLRAFLSQPIEAIQRQWVDKGASRQRLLDRYLTELGEGAGARAADAILDAAGVVHSSVPAAL